MSELFARDRTGQLSLAGVPEFEVAITIAADNRPIVESYEGFGFASLGQEHLLASIAPRLKIARIRAILDEAHSFARLQHMATDDGSRSLSVRLAINVQRLVVGHRWTRPNFDCAT